MALAKSKLNIIGVLISKALIDSHVRHDETVSINNSLKEFYDIKEEIKNSNNEKKFKLYIKQCCLIVWSVEKNTEIKTPKVVKTKNERIMLLSKCTVCNGKKSKFIKEQEPSGLLRSLGINTPLNKIPLLGPLLF